MKKKPAFVVQELTRRELRAAYPDGLPALLEAFAADGLDLVSHSATEQGYSLIFKTV